MVPGYGFMIMVNGDREMQVKIWSIMINFIVVGVCLNGEQRWDRDSVKVSDGYLTALDEDLTFKYR